MKLGIVALSVVLLLGGCADGGDGDGDRDGDGDARGGSSPAGEVDTRAVDLPAELAGLRDRADVVADIADEERAATERDNFDKSRARTEEWYDRAYDGAGFGMRTYADDDLEFLPTVIAVRAPSPGLTNGPVADPEVLGIAGGPSLPERVESDGVECVQFSTTTVPLGQEPDPDDIATGACRVGDETLTVFVYGVGSGADNQQRAVELARAAFDAID